MPKGIPHDQNFKNQILDYPLQAIEFYAAEQAQHLDKQPKIVPVRQEQLKKRLGDRFRELDTQNESCRAGDDLFEPSPSR